MTGLLLGAPRRSAGTAAAVAKRWIGWYLAHLNPDATIDDFQGAPGALKATGKRDSTDAYAGTFLSLARAYVEQTGDDRTLLDRFPLVQRVADAALRTQKRSGLTDARPDYAVAYLMDNCEVSTGLDDFSAFCRSVRKRTEAADYAERAGKVLAGIDNWLWDQTLGCYAWALHPDGKLESGLARWYPDWMANLMAVALLPEEERRNDLLVRLRRQFAAAPFPTPWKDEGARRRLAIGNTNDLEMVVWRGASSSPDTTR